MEDSGRQNDEKKSRKIGNAQSRATFFRHSAVLSLPALLLRKLPTVSGRSTSVLPTGGPSGRKYQPSRQSRTVIKCKQAKVQNQTTNPFQRLRDQLETMSHWDLLFFFILFARWTKKTSEY